MAAIERLTTTLMQISTPRRAGRLGMISLYLISVLIGVGVVACSPEESSNRTSQVETSSPIPQDILMPNLVGMYWVDAEPQLRSSGWAGMLLKGPNLAAAPVDRYRIMAQDPPAGEHLESDGQISLWFGS